MMSAHTVNAGKAAAATITATRSESTPHYRVIPMDDDHEFTQWERELDRLMRMRPQPVGKGEYR